MDPKYEYNAPQFVDFTCLDHDSAAEHEKYFGTYVYFYLFSC